MDGLTDGTAYQFKVQAVNASGVGAESDESDAAIPTAQQSATEVSEIEKKAAKDGMTAIGREILSSVDNVLMPRLRGASSKGIRIGGYTLPSGGVRADYVELERQNAGDHIRETRAESLDWLDGTSFSLALTATVDTETNARKMPGLILLGILHN